MTDNWKDEAKRIDQQVAEGREGEGLKPIKGKVSRPSDSVFTIRMPNDELTAIRHYTQAKGVSMSEFARDAMMKAMAEDAHADPLTGLVAGVQQLAKLARRVETARK